MEVIVCRNYPPFVLGRQGPRTWIFYSVVAVFSLIFILFFFYRPQPAESGAEEHGL